ncbi:MAG: STM3941 family protein [Lacibacter sp.]
MNKIEIPLSKTKILLLLIGSSAFVVFGVLFIITPEKFVSPIMRSSEIIRIVGVAGVLFFGATGVYGIRKMFDKKVGLTIDDNGITDNTNATSIGLIRWTEIIEIRRTQVMSTKFLLIYIKDPIKTLEKVTGMKRKLMESNMKVYGTPISVTSTTLKYNFDDLEKLLKERFIEQQQRMNQ